MTAGTRPAHTNQLLLQYTLHEQVCLYLTLARQVSTMDSKHYSHQELLPAVITLHRLLFSGSELKPQT